MAALGFIVLAAACVTAHAFPEPPINRNTIFVDEKLEGGAFENVDAFSNIALFNTADNPYRLPTTTKPSFYKVHWVINMTTLSFYGEVDIDLYATTENVNEMVLHAHDLNITDLSLSLGGAPVFQTFSLQPEYHFLRVRLTSGSLQFNATEPILYTLTIRFEAELRDDMYGIYKSWFRNDPNGPVSMMASTQFQATAARFAFPCYDEPSFKATFNISITRPRGYHSWSCTRLYDTENSTIDENFEQDFFHTTPVMSTYLLALIVADYESLPDNDTDLTYEVIARREAMVDGQGQLAFDLGRALLDRMSEHTAMDFYEVHPTIKMTQAAIPDFGAGAMENWGLLTYREAYLMYSPEHTSGNFEQLIGYILSHEIAHMWFGNLVTCDWWDVLWLNEGFARYYQYFLTDWVAPRYGLGVRFIPEQVHTSLLSDSANNPQPLSNPGVGSPAAVSAMFSTISYNKGAAIIRMTEHLMGNDSHTAGLRKYLETRQFETANPIDLFEDLQSVALETGSIAEYGPDFSIVDYYKSWTEQAGHPVLNVHVNHQTGIMTISQRRFNINTGYSTANTNWIIPITFYTASNPDYNNTKPTHIISESLSIINRSTIGDEWVIFNTQQTGFYRVNYDEYTWDLIALALRGPDRTNIHEFNRAQIVNDVFQFCRSGLMSYTRGLDILSFLKDETSYTPWVAAITGFNWIRNRVVNTTLEAPLNALILNWTSTVMSELTYSPTSDDEDFMTSYLRYMLAPVVCQLGGEQCLEAAAAQFSAFVSPSQTEVDINNREWVYCHGLRYGDSVDFEALWQRFETHNVYSEKITIIRALGCTRDRGSLEKFLRNIVEENFVIRPQDYSAAFSSAINGNEENTQIVFEFIQNNLETVANAFGSVTSPLSTVASRLRTREQVDEFRRWASENEQVLGTSFQPVFNAAETALTAFDWYAEVENDLSQAVDQEQSDINTSTPSTTLTTPPSTVTVGPISNPVTPNLPDSANTSFISVLTIMAALLAKIIL